MPLVMPELAVQKAAGVIESYEGRAGILIHVLQDLQEDLGYLPEAALERVAESLEMPLAEVLRVASFYAAFSLEPQGEHLICVCMGTACHVRGAPRIFDAVRRELDLGQDEQTSEDMKFTVKSVRCIGCCVLAPVITVDGDTHGKLSPDQIPGILERYG